MPYLPRDEAGIPIPVLGFGNSYANTCSSSVAYRFGPVTPGVKVISLYATNDIFVKFGNAIVPVTANTSAIIPANVYFDVCIGNEVTGGSSYINCLAVGSNAIVFLSERI